MATAFEIKKNLCDIGRRIYQNGFVAANDGNFSVKINDNEVLLHPLRAFQRGFMTPDMILKGRRRGATCWSPMQSISPPPSSKMHLRVYQERPDVNAVVHAHPPIATAHAVCGMALDTYIMPEAIISLGTVPLTKYGTPSTMEIPDAISEAFQNHDAVLLQNHGALSVGVSLINAYFKMGPWVLLPRSATMPNNWAAARSLPVSRIEKLLEVRKQMGVPGRHPGCSRCAHRGTPECHCLTPDQKATCQCHSEASGSKAASEDLVNEITKKVIAALK